LSTARAGHTAVLLPHNGAVLVAGGTAGTAPVTAVDLFMPAMFPDPYTWSMGSFAQAAPMTNARSRGVSGPAGDDGYAFVAGGGSPHDEAYAFTTIKTDRNDYAPGEAAVITGSGWQPYEEVTLVFQEDPAVHPDYALTLTADGDGKIFHDTWAPEQHDANVRFYLTATGVRSLRRAQMTFTDSVTSVTITSPTSASPVAVAPGASFTVGFSYVTSADGTTSATARLCQASNCNVGNTLATSVKSVTPGTSSNSILITVPVGTSAGADYTVEVEVTNTSGSGSNTKTDKQNNAVSVTGSAATTTSITAPAIFYGANGSVTVSVTSGSSTPTGEISLSVDGGTAVSRTLVAGSYTFTSTDIPALATPNAGGHSLSASYAGAAGFVASSAIGTLPVNRAPTVTTVVIVGGPFSYTGAAQTPATVTVTGPGGLSLTPAASYADNVDAGIATASYSYAGDGNYDPSSDSKSFSINKAASTTVTHGADPFSYDGTTHAGGSGSVTGAGGLDTAATSLTYTGDQVNAGTYYVTAHYAGDANHDPSHGEPVGIVINKAPSTAAVTGGTFNFDGLPHAATVVVSGVGTGITQTVTWSYSGTCSAPPVTVAQGTSCMVRADYVGDANHLPTFGTAAVSIAVRPTTTTLTSSLDLSVTPVRVVLTATVAGVPVDGPTPTGSVTFTDSVAGALGTVALSGSGVAVATFSTTTLGIGQHVVTATYNAAPNFGVSTSPANEAPVAAITGVPTGSINPVNVPFSFTGTFTDATAPAATAAWSFDATSSMVGTVAGSTALGTVAASKAFSAPGVYMVVLTVNDNLGGISIVDRIDRLQEMVIAYDPNAGFVTGGGWVDSPVGAYAAAPSLTGKATFGFVAKYKKGASVPEGETEFQFNGAGMNFKSTSYQWLVVQGTSKAQYKGVGTINGNGSYQFLVSVVDGSPDKLRVKITSGAAVVYDNLVGGGLDDAEPPTVLGGGSIVIHSK